MGAWVAAAPLVSLCFRSHTALSSPQKPGSPQLYVLYIEGSSLNHISKGYSSQPLETCFCASFRSGLSRLLGFLPPRENLVLPPFRRS